MPKLELGDLDAVARAKDKNIPVLAALVDEGWDIVAPIPSCVLMFKQELPLMFPHDDAGAKGGQGHFRSIRIPDAAAQGGKLRTDFARPLGKVCLSGGRATCGCRTSA